MKNLLLAALSLIAIGCTADESTGTQANSKDCSCNRVISAQTFNPIEGTFQVITYKNDCSDITRTVNSQGNQYKKGDCYGK